MLRVFHKTIKNEIIRTTRMFVKFNRKNTKLNATLQKMQKEIDDIDIITHEYETLRSASNNALKSLNTKSLKGKVLLHDINNNSKNIKK